MPRQRSGMSNDMTREFKLIDTFVSMTLRPNERVHDPNIARWFRRGVPPQGAPIETVVADMDEAGIEMAFLTANGAAMQRLISGSPYRIGEDIGDQAFDDACRDTNRLMSEYPGRFQACVAIDPSAMTKSVRQLERAAKDFGFRFCWLMPALVGTPPNHQSNFPIYAKCAELGIPIRINLGVPGPMLQASSQRPIDLDEVLVAFPELTVIGTHVGHPWHLETLSMLERHTNFYLMTAGWAPKRVPHEIWEFANSRGGAKIMWASDYPILTMQRCAEEGWDVPLKDNVKRRYLRDNALAVFGLEGQIAGHDRVSD
jgi:uncharacterized protein